ncbi:MAG: hypothetical protein L0220_20615 [Acidobacteria bacterium]|nr:hypothetical protein [Acidobacteriota bacterium]
MLRRSILVASMSVNLFFNIASAQSVGNPALRKELLDMQEADQQIRRELSRKRASGALDASDTQRAQSVDTANRTRLKQIIEQYGWPGKSLVGEDGASAAWLIVQHADRDRDFQKKCLTLLQEAVSKGEASKINLAYLTDRLLVAEGKPQIYGTQIRRVDGKPSPYPIEDEANVDKRRAELGMGTMADYLKLFR